MEALKNLKAVHFDFTPLRFVALNVTFNVILSAMRSEATNVVEVLLCFSKPLKV